MKRNTIITMVTLSILVFLLGIIPVYGYMKANLGSSFILYKTLIFLLMLIPFIYLRKIYHNSGNVLHLKIKKFISIIILMNCITFGYDFFNILIKYNINLLYYIYNYIGILISLLISVTYIKIGLLYFRSFKRVKCIEKNLSLFFVVGLIDFIFYVFYIVIKFIEHSQIENSTNHMPLIFQISPMVSIVTQIHSVLHSFIYLAIALIFINEYQKRQSNKEESCRLQ